MFVKRPDIIMGLGITEAGMAAGSRRSFTSTRPRTPQAEIVLAGARRRPCTFTRKRPRRTGRHRSGRGFNSVTRYRSVGTRHPRMAPVATPNDRPTDRCRVFAKAGMRPREVPARTERRELRPIAWRGRAGSEKTLQNNWLRLKSERTNPAFRPPDCSR